MTLARLCAIALLALLLAGAARAQQLVAVPPLAAHVTDLAGMLDAGQRSRLDAVLADYEQKSGSQIAILLVPSTAPEAIEQYSIRVADAWKLGRKGIDDGVLLVVAKDNPKSLRRLRIEAGRGVQGVLTDAQSKRILQDVIAPHFRQNDYYGGLVAGSTAIAALLDKEHFAAPKAKGQQAELAPQDLLGIGFALLMLVLGGALLLSQFRSQRTVMGGNRWGHEGTGFILGNILGAILSNAGRGSHGGGSWGGGSGGGGWSGGGGGGFDGGGASGDW